MSHILEKISETIKKHDMLNAGDKVLIALSGGADSVCLLRVLAKLKDTYKITLYAAHLNHMLRGKDADDDEEFAESLCNSLNIPFFSKRADVAKFAKENSLTCEEAGRTLRYSFFSELSEKLNIQKIATAHNSGDNAETVLMRFIRGTQISGLSGIPYKNNNIIRPLLDVSRSEIEAFLKEEKSDFVTDKTNNELLYFRNKIRLELIPEIEEKYNPNFKETLLKNVIGYNQASDFLKMMTDEKAKELVRFCRDYAYINICELLGEHDYIISSVIHKVLSKLTEDKEITFRAVEDISKMAKENKGSLEFSKDINVCVLYDKLYFVKKRKTEPFLYSINVPGEFEITECGVVISFSLCKQKEKAKDCIFIDYDKLAKKKISVRNRKDGDFFYPKGLTGKKKIKDFFIDEKIPVFLRDDIPLILADDEIICVGSFRENENFKVDSQTKNVLKIKIIYGG